MKEVIALQKFLRELSSDVVELGNETLRDCQLIANSLFRVFQKLWGHEKREGTHDLEVAKSVIEIKGDIGHLYIWPFIKL